MEKIKIFDLHADLLCYLANDSTRSPYNEEVLCSIPQLKAGNVHFQGLPIFTVTEGGSSLKGIKQSEVFKNLFTNYPHEFKAYQTEGEGIEVCAAIENASSFSEEKEPFEESLKRLETIEQNVGKILYISLTWNSENRFGGGAHTSIGLKEDGEKLLEWMNRKNIAVDLSHTSDPLAYDILNRIEALGYTLPVLASHSNMRNITSVPRNLPDELAKEIWRRGGVIGINFVRYFVGSESPQYFAKQLEYMIKLGGEDQICFGADFFYDNDVPQLPTRSLDEIFFPEFTDASAYPRLLTLLQRELRLGDQVLKKIAYRNLEKFLEKRCMISV